jgi:hypothetical protein
MEILDLLAHPQISTPYVQIGSSSVKDEINRIDIFQFTKHSVAVQPTNIFLDDGRVDRNMSEDF